MKSKHFSLAFFLVAGLLCAKSFGQNSRWYFGSGLGAQHWRGPLNANVGMGGELVVGRQLSHHSALALVAGFASLPFQQSTLNNGVKFILTSREANLFHGDFLVDLHPLGMSTFSPFARLGGGVLNVQVGSAARKNYMSGVLGAGLRLQLTRDLALNLTGSYHHLAGQALEGFAADKNPSGFVSARMGFTFSARSGNEQFEEPWVTTSDTELSPFENSPQNNTAAPASAPVAEIAARDSSEKENKDFLVDEQTEAQPEEEGAPALAEVQEPIQPSVEPAPAAAEITLAPSTPSSNEAPVDANDPYARFNRKLDFLDEASSEESPEPSTEPISVLGDEPKFEEFYPQAKPEAVQSFKDKLFAATPPANEDEEESEPEPVSSNAAFEERLARLDEQEDFLSPTTVIADAPTVKQPEREEEQPAPLPVEPSSPPASKESVSQNQDAVAAPYSAPEKKMTAAAPKVDSHKSPEHARTENLSARPNPTPREALPKTIRPAPAPQERPKPPRSNRPEEEELRELRAILDKLDAGGASNLERELNTANALALNSDPEVQELSLRLDEIEGEQFAYEKSSEAYEAFKDRLGLEEDPAQKEEPVEWNQQQLKSQLNNIDEELAQKEEDLTAIRTALAQSAATGAAFPTSTLVTRGSFAQGYESALNSFYQQSHEDAIEKFSRLLEQFPSHTLTSNCYYWLGEAQYGFGDYVTALASFNRVLTFQRSLKKDNALLMLGKTYLALQRSTDARAMFNRLLSEYPASDAVTKAQELMKGM